MTAESPRFAVSASRLFTSWLASTGASLAVTTYQSGKILLFGTRPDGSLAVFERSLDRPMGLAVSGDRLAVGTLTQIVTFVDAAADGSAADRAAQPFDAAYIPQVAHFTGDLDGHDMAFDGEGRLVFANTLFSCLARASDTRSFTAIWKPPFVSRLAAEDRCHLNGLCLRDGRPAFVTAVATTDVTDGWREHRREGGVVVDVPSGEIAGAGLSMPHSPRLHDGRLYVLNSGAGEFGVVDLGTGRFEPIAFLPGYGRGLAFVGPRHAVVGLSEPRENRTFAGLPLQERLERERVSPRCGLMVVDLVSGDVAHWLRIEGVVRELYDVAALAGRRNPSLIGFRSDEIRRTLSFDAEMDGGWTGRRSPSPRERGEGWGEGEPGAGLKGGRRMGLPRRMSFSDGSPSPSPGSRPGSPQPPVKGASALSPPAGRGEGAATGQAVQGRSGSGVR